MQPTNLSSLATRPQRGLSRRLPIAGALTFLLAQAAAADISGTVVDDSNVPIAGATVRVQAEPTLPTATTDALGQFTLPLATPGQVRIAASVTYEDDNALNWHNGTIDTNNPGAGVQIVVNRVPAGTNNSYSPPLVNNSCAFCHSEIAAEWSTSVHAGAGRDFWVRDLFSGDGSPGGSAGYVFTATHDPGETGTCATCHQVMSDVFDPGNTMFNTNTGPGVQDGVSCLGCHQMHTVEGDVDAIHTLGQSEYRFPQGNFATDRYVWGPLDDVGGGIMQTSHAPFFKSSQLCASCHQYERPFGQTTFDEWLASPYAVPGPGFRSCQDCHMVQREEPGFIADLGDPPIRPAHQRHRHDMVGSTLETLAANLTLAATAQQNGDLVSVQAQLTNAGAGHDFPTGISIRNAFLVIEASYNGQPLAQVQGPTLPSWASDDVPGVQPGDLGGLAGRGYGKILEGQINGQGPVVWPVLFIDAQNVREKHTIPAGETDQVDVAFAVPPDLLSGDSVDVRVRVLYRRAFRALAVTKGWTQTPQGGPIEIEVATEELSLPIERGLIEVPAAGPAGLAALVAALALVGLALLRRG